MRETTKKEDSLIGLKHGILTKQNKATKKTQKKLNKNVMLFASSFICVTVHKWHQYTN